MNLSLASPYKNLVTKKLTKYLQSELKYLNQSYKFKDDLFTFLRERSIKLKEKPLNPQIRLELSKNRKYYIITFLAGSYSELASKSKKRDSFDFQLSYNVGEVSFLSECFATDEMFCVVRCFLTGHPIQVLRDDKMNRMKGFRGPYPWRTKLETVEAWQERFEEDGFGMEFIKSCVEIARDKEERLRTEWVEKVLKFINT